MGDYSTIGDGITALFRFMIFSLIVLLPLALWKLIDIVVWLFQHVRIGAV